MAYDNPGQRTYDFDFVGGTNRTCTFRVPKGRRSRLQGLTILDTGTATVTGGLVTVGTSASPALYASLPMGVIAANGYLDASTVVGAFVTDTRSLANSTIPADSDIVVTITAPTTGTGRVSVKMNEW